MNLFEKLTKVQNELKAPKNQKNTFGNYNYRNCEDILEAVKPLLLKHDLTLVVNDEIVLIGDRFYVKATAIISFDSHKIENTAYARESESKKGMDSAQITGAASSYARKYALNGLFLIDDTKDADSMDNSKQGTAKPKDDKPWYNDFDKDQLMMANLIKTGQRTHAQLIDNLRKTMKVSKETESKIKGLGNGE